MERSRRGPALTDDSRQPAAQATTIDERLFKRVVEGYLGVPYARGGSDSAGMDCSNLVSVLFRDYSGTSLPPSTRALWHLPREVSREELAVGDLVFF
ncbi:MAG: C40 family peptidase, partial [candidate division Zixibacteria bacterium]|nr:C40 family peptidase [candidate division Zixibacteria bacterium]